MQPSLTMLQIAEELNLSRLTVSSVINGHARKRGISKETEERVRVFLREKGYVPSRQARDLRQGARDAVGILHCGRLYSHLTQAFNLFIEHYAAGDCPPEVMVVKRDGVLDGLQELIARRVSKLIWIQTSSTPDEFPETNLIAGYLKSMKVVVYNNHFEGSSREDFLVDCGAHLVGVDRRDSFRRLALFLKKLGHRTIAIPDRCGGTAEFLSTSAFESIRQAGLKTIFTRPQKMEALDIRDTCKRFARGLINARKRDPITAAVFMDDEVAGHTMAELIKAGVRIPEDLTVTGWDGMSFCDALCVPLTTMEIPVQKMVECARGLLGKRKHGTKHIFEPTLIKRQSHARAQKT